MGFFEIVVGMAIIGVFGGVIEELLGETPSFHADDDSYESSDDYSYTSSKGYHNLHNAAERNHGIALNNCENCRWHGSNSCRWQENCYASPGKYHEHVCDNYEPKW